MSEQTEKDKAEKDKSKQDAKKDEKDSKKDSKTNLLHESERHQDKELAKKGLYQPFDQVANKPQGGYEEDTEENEAHRANVRNMPPVPSEKAGAASQAK